MIKEIASVTDAVEIPRDKFRITLSSIAIPVAAALCVGAADSFLQVRMFEDTWLWLESLCLIFGIYGMPALLVWLIVMLAGLAKAMRRRMWKKLVSRLLILVCVMPLMIVALGIGPYLHFGLSYPYYMTKVKQSPDGGSKPITFSWGGSGFVGSAQTDRWLVYDPTGETAARPAFEKETEALNAWYEVEHLFGRFYLVERHQG